MAKKPLKMKHRFNLNFYLILKSSLTQKRKVMAKYLDKAHNAHAHIWACVFCPQLSNFWANWADFFMETHETIIYRLGHFWRENGRSHHARP